ncbi:MAG: hypothetical protein WCK39_09850 [Methanomassiliicoccales archaeon]
MDDRLFPGMTLLWKRESISGKLWTLRLEGKIIASIQSSIFGRRGKGNYGDRSFTISKAGFKDPLVFRDDGNGLPLAELSRLAFPCQVSKGGILRYQMMKTGTFDYALRDMTGRMVLSIHVDKHSLLTYNFAGMQVREANKDDLDLFFLSAVFMFVVKHHLPFDWDAL